MRNIWIFKSRRSQHLVLPTCGGGSPPAPAGHSGSILFRPSQLHSHRGEGFSIVQLPLSNMLVTLWETGGTDHSSSTGLQEVPLKHREKNFIINSKNLFYAFLSQKKTTTHGMGSLSMQRVPNPGFSVRAPSSLLMWGSSGKSLLQREIGHVKFHRKIFIIGLWWWSEFFVW